MIICENNNSTTEQVIISLIKTLCTNDDLKKALNWTRIIEFTVWFHFWTMAHHMLCLFVLIQFSKSGNRNYLIIIIIMVNSGSMKYHTTQNGVVH